MYGEGIIKLLDFDLECNECKIKNDKIIMRIFSTKQQIECPDCGIMSSRIHSTYQREIQDIPLHDKQTTLLLNTRKVYCDNPECTTEHFQNDSTSLHLKVKRPTVLLIKY